MGYRDFMGLSVVVFCWNRGERCGTHEVRRNTLAVPKPQIHQVEAKKLRNSKNPKPQKTTKGKGTKSRPGSHTKTKKKKKTS
jgi:hypothetical protein